MQVMKTPSQLLTCTFTQMIQLRKLKWTISQTASPPYSMAMMMNKNESPRSCGDKVLYMLVYEFSCCKLSLIVADSEVFEDSLHIVLHGQEYVYKPFFFFVRLPFL